MASNRYEYNMADAIEALLRETTALHAVNPERVTSLRALAEESRAMREAALEYESLRASAASTTGSLTSEFSGSELSATSPEATALSSMPTSESSDSSDGFNHSTGELFYPSDSECSDASGIWKVARSFAALRNKNSCDEAYKRAVEHLVMRLRNWRMELEEAKYTSIDFDAPLKRWTRRERNTFRAEIREMSYEIRKKHVLEKMVELNKRRTSLGQTQETKLAVELIELLLQDIFLLRIMPFKDVVFPLHMDNIYDWDRVSDAIKGTHNPAECQEAWYTKFHPNINGKAWSKAENRLLFSLADRYNLDHWDEIAKELGTNRSGFQCYVQYRRFLYKDKSVVLKLSHEPNPNANGHNKA